MKLKNKSKIEAWLEAGELEQVLDELIAQLKASKVGGDFLKTATSLSSQLEKLRDDRLKGILTYEQETVTFNKLHDKVQILIESIEKDKPPKPPVPPKEPTPPPPKPQPTSTSVPSNEKANNWLWYLGFAAVAFGVWWMMFRSGGGPIESTIHICTMEHFDDLNWCNRDMTRLSIVEATLNKPTVSAVFEGQNLEDPYILGTVYDSQGNVFPTQRIQLTMTEGGVGYAAEIVPSDGVQWATGIYTIKLSLNDEPAGEKEFEVFNDMQIFN